LARAILELLQDRDKAQRLGQAGRRLMEERYSIRRVVSDLEQIYYDLARGRKQWQPYYPEAPEGAAS
jgi:glycosyltransferase involved in cell wall biosynthesis